MDGGCISIDVACNVYMIIASLFPEAPPFDASFDKLRTYSGTFG